jgi:hypothetical protein
LALERSGKSRRIREEAEPRETAMPVSTAIILHDLHEGTRPSALDARIGALRAAFAAYRRARETYRKQRATYRQTLRELRSYRPRELHDLRIDPADFEAIARRHAGW